MNQQHAPNAPTGHVGQSQILVLTRAQAAAARASRNRPSSAARLPHAFRQSDIIDLGTRRAQHTKNLTAQPRNRKEYRKDDLQPGQTNNTATWFPGIHNRKRKMFTHQAPLI
jgi:hypothetical protein